MQSGTTSNEASSYLIVWDTEPDQLCVPALFSRIWHPAKPRTGMMAYFGTYFCMVLHGCRNLDTCLFGLHNWSELSIHGSTWELSISC